MPTSLQVEIFSSYTSDLDDYVQPILELIRKRVDQPIYDWREHPLAIGEKIEALRGKVEGASIFLAFISERYQEGVAAQELSWFLDKLPKKDVYFAPLLFSQKAKDWWDEVAPDSLKSVIQGRFYKGDLPLQLHVQVEGSERVVMNPAYRSLIEPLIKQMLEFLASRETEESPDPFIPDKAPAILLLGHPSAELPEAAASARQNFLEAIRAELGDENVLSVPDGWSFNSTLEAREVFELAKHRPVHIIQLADGELAERLTAVDGGAKVQEVVLGKIYQELADGSTNTAIEKGRDNIGVRRILWIPAELSWALPKETAVGPFELRRCTATDLSDNVQELADPNADLVFQTAFPDLNRWAGTNFVKDLGVRAEARNAFINKIKNTIATYVERYDRLPLILVVHDHGVPASTDVKKETMTSLMARIRTADEAIQCAKLDRPPWRIVRVIYNINKELEYKDSAIATSNAEWIVLPLNPQLHDDMHFTFHPDPDAIEYIKNQLQFKPF
ncbi:hypothetical protein ACC668_02895 [Rhizobium ruizarguesonis]